LSRHDDSGWSAGPPAPVPRQSITTLEAMPVASSVHVTDRDALDQVDQLHLATPTFSVTIGMV
jgi:hypothetical protein